MSTPVAPQKGGDRREAKAEQVNKAPRFRLT
jgi:hypothetical protein